MYGVIGAVALRWYWGLFLAMWALVFGATLLVARALRRKKDL